MAAASWNPPHLQWVVKVSKLCNLRCRYCYEFPELGNRERMSLPQLEAMFSNIAEYFRGTSRKMDFVWHGGEPLLHTPGYYRKIFELQDRLLGQHGVPYTNSIQTNLTVINDDILDLLRSSFDHIGVSIDLFGGNRVFRSGREAEEAVIKNMQRLQDEGIPFGCITVLSQSTAPHVEEIYDFFESSNVSFRLLPIYRTGYAGQLHDHELTPQEIVTALIKVVERWLTSDTEIEVRPIQEYFCHVVRYLSGDDPVKRFYDKRAAEVVMIVNTDGNIFSNGDAYDTDLCHGNIFSQGFGELRTSAGFLRACQMSEERTRQTCAQCEYHGSCSGYFMAEATPEQRWISGGQLTCAVARPVQQYIERRLKELGVVDGNGYLSSTELRRRANIIGDDGTEHQSYPPPVTLVGRPHQGAPLALHEAIDLAQQRLLNVQQPSGFFLYTYNPVTGSASRGAGNLVRQVGCAYSLALAAAGLPEGPRQQHHDSAERLLNAVGGLDVLPPAPGWSASDDQHRQVQSSLGLTALTLLTLEYMGTRRAQELQLIDAMLELQEEGGAFRCTAQSPSSATDGAKQDYYPGEALLALSIAAGRGNDRCRAAVHSAFDFYSRYFRRNPSMAFVGWQANAWLQFYKWARASACSAEPEPEKYVQFVFEMIDWLLTFQLRGMDIESHLRGGFTPAGGLPGAASCVYVESVIKGLEAARAAGDQRREEAYLTAAEAGLSFISQLQVTADSAVRCPKPELAVGGIMRSFWDVRIRCDNDQHFLTACRAAVDQGILTSTS